MKKYLFLCLMLMSAAAWGEIRVTDTDGETLPYASVKGMTKKAGTLTDSLGVVAGCPEGIVSTDTVVVSYPGYSPVRLTWGEFEARGGVALTDKGIKLETVTVLPRKIKREVKGKKHSGGLILGSYDDVKGMNCGYEFHTKPRHKNLLSSVGFYYKEVDNPNFRTMSRMKLRVQVYDMRNVTKDYTNQFIAVGTPFYIDYVYDASNDGKFTYQLPELIELPQDAMVAIECVEDVPSGEAWVYRSNMVGKSCWSQSLKERFWMKEPFASPFFAEVLDVKD